MCVADRCDVRRYLATQCSIPLGKSVGGATTGPCTHERQRLHERFARPVVEHVSDDRDMQPLEAPRRIHACEEVEQSLLRDAGACRRPRLTMCAPVYRATR